MNDRKQPRSSPPVALEPLSNHARVIAVHSFRGGAGKSTVVANVALWIARSGRRVAVIDTNLQSPGVHLLLGVGDAEIECSLNDFIAGRTEILRAAYPLAQRLGIAAPGRLYLLPASMHADSIAQLVREGLDARRLREGIDELARALDLDVILLDTPSGLGEESLFALSASHSLLLVLRPERQDYRGAELTISLAGTLGVQCVHLLLNDLPEGTQHPGLFASLEKAFGHTMIGVLPHCESQWAAGSTGLHSLREPDSELTSAFAALVPALLA